MVQLLKNLERACEGLAHGKGSGVNLSIYVNIFSPIFRSIMHA